MSSNDPIAEALAATPDRVYKDDRRSKVWLYSTATGRFIAKQSNDPCWRQRPAWAIGRHSFQREQRVFDRLRQLGVPGVDVMACRMVENRAILITRWGGPSLLHRLRATDLDKPVLRKAVADQLVSITATLINAGLFHRDFKTSNLVVDDEGIVRLIDVAVIRDGRSIRHAHRMIAILNRTLPPGRVSRTDRMRFFNQLFAQCDKLRDPRYPLNAMLRDPMFKL